MTQVTIGCAVEHDQSGLRFASIPETGQVESKVESAEVRRWRGFAGGIAMVQEAAIRILQKIAMVVPGGTSVRPWLQRLRGVKIGKNVFIAQYVYIDDIHPEEISIGDNCTIGLRSTIFAHFYWGPRRPKSNGKVIIENDVFVGPHCVILPNVTIGEGAVIKAGTVVTTNVPPHTFWGSPPAGPLAEVTVPLTNQHTYEEFVRGTKIRKRATAQSDDGGSNPA